MQLEKDRRLRRLKSEKKMKVFVFVLVAFLAPIAVQCRAGVQRSAGSAGSCPYQRPSVKDCQQGWFFAERETECFDDEECESSLKCCQRECEMKCVAPVHYNKWCKAPVDLGILFDTQSNDLDTVKKMMSNVTHNLSVSRGATHIALMPIEKDSELLYKFDGKQNRTEVWKIINNMHTGLQRQSEKLSTALSLAKRDMFSETNGGRPGAIKVLLVITDANVDENEGSHLETVSKSLRKAGILVQTVGVTMEMSLMHLVEIATSDVYVWPEVSADMLAELKKLEKEPCQ